MNIDVRLQNLYDDLARVEGRFNDRGALGRAYNALLEEVKQQHEGDPVLAGMQPVGFGGQSGNTLGGGPELRAMAGQLLAIVRE